MTETKELKCPACVSDLRILHIPRERVIIYTCMNCGWKRIAHDPKENDK